MVKGFHEIHVQDVSIVGGKGANLGEMTSTGLNVPEGFVVTADAYRLFLRENGLDEKFEKELNDAGNDESSLLMAAETFRKDILAGVLPIQIKEAIEKAYATLGNEVSVAVRSSATAEDLIDASFAGQQETYLNVVGIEEVCRQILRCYASLWGNRAVVYRNNQGYAQTEVALAVVVQKMIKSEVSGVLFTANPLNNNRQQMKLNASYGLGEAVVSGRVSADSFVCNKEGAILEQKMGSKEIKIVYAKKENESGTEERIVSRAERTKFCLTEQEVKKICLAGVAVENYYGMPMDIEWGMENGEVYILQARAITTLSEKENAEEEALVQQYLSKSTVKGMQRSNMAFMLEKMPVAYYPFDYELMTILIPQLCWGE